MPTQDEEIARHLREALESGELAGTPGFGKPLPEDVGLGRNARVTATCRSRSSRTPGLVPAEVELFHERAALSAALRACQSEAERAEVRRRLSDLEQKIALRLESLRVNGTL